MSIIQTIRDKGAKISVMLIALALIGFILTDYFSGKGRASGAGGRGSVGRVNGTSVGFEEFSKKVDQAEETMKQQGYPNSPALRQQAMDQAWNQEIASIILTDEFDKLGLDVGKKELGDILYGPNAPDDLKKQFTDEKTGQFNPVAAKSAVDQLLKKKAKTPEEQAQKDNFNSYVTQLELNRKEQKYVSLVSVSSNFPRWYIEKYNGDNSQMAKISMVREVYTSIPDSSVTISEKEITDYISKHKDDYKQEESRSINFVSFNASPSAADSLDTKTKLLALKPAFDSTNNLRQFLAGEGTTNFYDGYINGKTIQIGLKDSIFKTPVGSIYGPYLDGGSYVLAKMLGTRQMPDTVKARHILIATSQRDPQSGQTYQTRDTVSAKKLIDSIQTAIRNGSNFDSLCVKLSEDPGSKDKGGVYESVTSGQMTEPFNDFLFLNPAGTKGVVKTDFGYHYIEIISQKGGGAGYKIAYLPKEITASSETDNNALNMANQFAGDSRDQKSFDETFEKTLKPKGLVKGNATGITPIGAEVRGVGFSRSFVKNIYSASLGEVLKPERIDDKYVVAVVTDILKEGTQSATVAGPLVEQLLKTKKKAEMLKQKLGKVTTLEAAAAAWGNKQIETVDSLRMTGKGTITTMNYEPKVSGAVFNPANKGKIVPEAIEGINGVYVVRVENVSVTPLTNANVADIRKQFYSQSKQFIENPQGPGYPANALKNAATIKDNRADKF
ncbi:MAG: peptidylprolyl isomerase [Chitinophagaceae bacterium]